MKRKRTTLLAMMVMAAIALVAPKSTVFAHGGEDHGEKQPPAVFKGTNMVTRVARVGDLEVVIKHPPIEPDKEAAARLFVTHFASNEPVGGAKIIVTFSGGGSPVEVAAAPNATAPGMYDVKLPPLPKGQYKVVARIDHDGNALTADYGAWQVAPLPIASNEVASSWARTVLIGLALLVGLAVIGVILYRVIQATRSGRIKGETATA
jgi:hypothetical protein